MTDDDPTDVLLCAPSSEVCDCEDYVLGELTDEQAVTLLLWRAMWRHTPRMERGEG